MSKLIVRFGPMGRVETRVEGIPGQDCRAASEPYLKLVPGTTVSDTPTAEADLPPMTVSVGQQAQLG